MLKTIPLECNDCKIYIHHRSMTNDEIDNLTRQLERLRLRRENAIRIVTEANEAEVNIIARIRRARAINPRRQNNPHREGDIVYIKNTLRNECSIVVTVLPPCTQSSRLLRIRNQETQRVYTRGWWNLELVVSTPSQNQNMTRASRTDPPVQHDADTMS